MSIQSEIALEKSKGFYKRNKKRTIKKKYQKTVEDKKLLHSLYIAACECIELKGLIAIRQSDKTKILKQTHYLKFIRLTDRLMETL